LERTLHQIHNTIDVLVDNTERERCRSKPYVLVEGKLYRKNAKEEQLQKCVSMEEGKKILKEIHTGKKCVSVEPWGL